jgi:hypothetical protein
MHVFPMFSFHQTPGTLTFFIVESSAVPSCSENTAVFKVRQVGYAKSKEKAPSEETLFMPVAIDYLTAPEKVRSCCRHR